MHILKYLLATLLLMQNIALSGTVNSNGRSPLHYAIIDKSGIRENCAESPETINVLKSLITSGCNVNARDDLGQTPLHYAILCNALDAARILIEAGAGVNAQDNGGLTPLHHAASWGQADALDLLIKAGADLNIKDDAAELIHLCDDPRHQGLTPLAVAVVDNRPIIVQRLLNAGSNISVQDRNGDTLLHLAAEVGEPWLVELLLRAGADRDIKNHQGRAPYEVAGMYADHPDRWERAKEIENMLENWDRKDPKNAPTWHYKSSGGMWIFTHTDRSWEQEPTEEEQKVSSDALSARKSDDISTDKSSEQKSVNPKDFMPDGFIGFTPDYSSDSCSPHDYKDGLPGALWVFP